MTKFILNFFTSLSIGGVVIRRGENSCLISFCVSIENFENWEPSKVSDKSSIPFIPKALKYLDFLSVTVVFLPSLPIQVAMDCSIPSTYMLLFSSKVETSLATAELVACSVLFLLTGGGLAYCSCVWLMKVISPCWFKFASLRSFSNIPLQKLLISLFCRN